MVMVSSYVCIEENTNLRVLITDTDLGDGSIERSVLAGHAVDLLQSREAGEIIDAGEEADGLLVQWAEISADVMDHLPRLRSIVRYGIGVDNVDLEAAKARNICVSNVPDYCIEEVAHHTVALVTTKARGLMDYGRLTKAGQWTVSATPIPKPPSLDPVGFLGMGRIGTSAAVKLRAVGHPVFAWDPFKTDWPEWVAVVSSPAELASLVNHLSLHLPHTSETDRMVDASVLLALGPEGHLVNTSRGGLLDERALLEALTDRTLGYASLDVFRTEPPTGVGAELVAHPRVLATPHAAYLSTESKTTLQRRAAEIMRDSLEEPHAY